jgi:hypothetical protein
VTDTFCGLSPASSEISKEPWRIPGYTGLKRTLTLQLPFGAIVAIRPAIKLASAQVNVSEKSPELLALKPTL